MRTLLVVVVLAVLATLAGAMASDAAQARSSSSPRALLARAASGPGAVPLGHEASLRHVRVVRRGRAAALDGDLRVACPLAGEVIGDVTAPAPGGGSTGWSTTVTARTGPEGCTFTREVTLPANFRVSVRLRVDDGGNLVVAVDADTDLDTTLIPTQKAFRLSLSLVVGRDVFSASVSGSAAGASFAGDVRRDGTFGFDYELDGVDVAGNPVPARGRVQRTSPDGDVEVSLRGAADKSLPLLDNVELRDARLSWVDDRVEITGTTRVHCTSGYIDLGTGGGMNPDGSFELVLQGQASKCTIGTSFMVFDGDALRGDIKWADGALRVSIGFAVASIDLGVNPSGDLGVVTITLGDVAGEITNDCADCAPDHLRLSFAAAAHIVLQQPGVAMPVDLHARLKGQFDLIGWKSLRIAITLDDIRYGDIPLSLAVDMEGALVQSVEGAFVVDESAPPPSVTVRPTTPAAVSGQGVVLGNEPVQSVVVVLGSCRAARSCRPKARVEVRMRSAAQVRLTFQRRTCQRGSCRWQTFDRAVYAPDSGGRTVRAWVGRAVRSGRYRVTARAVRGAARTVTRTFVVP